MFVWTICAIPVFVLCVAAPFTLCAWVVVRSLCRRRMRMWGMWSDWACAGQVFLLPMSRVRGFATSSFGAFYTLLGEISDGRVSKNACEG
jgi:hypothetical protein